MSDKNKKKSIAETKIKEFDERLNSIKDAYLSLNFLNKTSLKTDLRKLLIDSIDLSTDIKICRAKYRSLQAKEIVRYFEEKPSSRVTMLSEIKGTFEHTKTVDILEALRIKSSKISDIFFNELSNGSFLSENEMAGNIERELNHDD